MAMLDAVSGTGKVGLATLAYPFAALGTGVRAGVANAVGAPKPTDTAADAVAAFGASGVDDLKAARDTLVTGAKDVAAGAFGLTPAAPAAAPTAPPTVVGQTPAAPTSTQALLDKTANTISNTPIDAVPSNKFDDVVAAVAAKSAGNSFSDTGINGSVNIGATPIAAPAAAAVAKPAAPALNPVIMEQQQALMAQIAAAQGVVQAGSNRDGYKMGDVTKALATMNHLSPLVASSNNLMGANYGADAGIINHTADNVTRTDISNAGNATEMAKANLAGQYGVAGHEITARANLALAEQKARLDALSPAGQKALVEARTAARNFDDTAGLAGVERVRGVMGKAQDFQQVKDVTGVTRGRMVDGKYVPFVENEINQIAPPSKKK